MIDYEVGSRPSRSLTLFVRDELDNPINVVGYDTWRLEMLDTDDRPVDLSGVTIDEIPNVIGAFNVTWPKDRSLFTKRGKYVLRLVLGNNNGTKDITRTAEIRVREYGRLN